MCPVSWPVLGPRHGMNRSPSTPNSKKLKGFVREKRIFFYYQYKENKLSVASGCAEAKIANKTYL